jgi:hypothetical protein
MNRNLIHTVMAAAIILIVCGSAPAKPKKRHPAKPRNRVAVITSRYDDVDKVLTLFKIPHDVLYYRDLETPEKTERYRSLFVPSGVDYPIEEMLDVSANNFRFKSVALKPDFYEVDKDRVARTLRRFVKNGGSAYFSGYTYEHLQRAFDMLEFFSNFPYMGMPARLEATVFNDLSRFSMKKRMALYMDHPGWIAIREAHGAEVIAFATFETPRGVRSGPISILARRGSGELLYTSYDSTVFSDFRRFNIYRIAGAHIMERLEDEAYRWGQAVTGRIVNAIHDNEYAAMHRIDLAKGNNTIYFFSEKEFYQIDIVDRNLSLIESRDLLQREQIFTVESAAADYCYIRLYPYANDRFGMYGVVSASGRRIIPYLNYILAVLAAAAAGGVAFVVYRLFFASGYSGRGRL